MNLIKTIVDRVQGKAPKGAKRSPLWSKVRKEFLKKNPRCAVCDSTSRLQVHHKIPFHVVPAGIKCHLLVGHLGNFRRSNLSIEFDIDYWRKKLKDTIAIKEPELSEPEPSDSSQNLPP